MISEQSSFDVTDAVELRRCILKSLYEMFKDHPYAPIELIYLEETCNVTAKDLNWNIVYLEKCGYLEIDRSSDCPPYISCAATITAEGIDLVENKKRFLERFPQ